MGFFDKFISSVTAAAEQAAAGQAAENATVQEAPAAPEEPKEMELKFGTPEPVPYRGETYGSELTVQFTVAGKAKVCSEDAEKVRSNGGLEALKGVLTADIVRLIKEGLANCSAMNIRISLLPSRTNDISRSIKTKLDPEWRDKYGVSIASLGILPPTMTSESREAVAKLQKAQLAGE